MLQQSFTEGYKPLFDESVPKSIVLASAIAALLVQQHEVVACVTQNGTCSEGQKLLPPESLIKGFVATVNPDDKQPEQMAEYILAQKGSSLLSKVSSEHWNWLRKMYV